MSVPVVLGDEALVPCSICGSLLRLAKSGYFGLNDVELARCPSCGEAFYIATADGELRVVPRPDDLTPSDGPG